MARRFQKVKELDTLVAADGSESPEKELIVIGAKWAPFVAEGRLTEISPDSSEDPLPADSTAGVVIAASVPVVGLPPVVAEAWGTGAPPQKIFPHTLVQTPVKPGSVAVKATTPAVAASKTFTGELAALTATAVTAGVGGNSITLEFVDGGASPIEGVVEVGNVITVTYASSGTASTVGSLVTLINGSATLVTAAGTGAVALTAAAAQGPTALTGGAAAATTVVATDSGPLGVLSGIGVTGTVNYTSGLASVTFTTAPATGVAITVDYLPPPSTLTLPSALPHNSPVVMKNGVVLAHPADFTIATPTTIALVVPANGTDRYTVAFYYPTTSIGG